MAGRTATNAPRHWPEVQITNWSGNPAVNLLLIASTLAGLGDKVRLAFSRDLLYEDGLVRIPLLVEEGAQKTAVFLYPKPDDAAAAHYSAARALLRQREAMNAVYYAPEALLPAKGGRVLERLDTLHFSTPGKERAPAEYALWWPTPEDPRLANSPALRHLDAWFESLDGYASYVFSSFVRVLQLTEGAKKGEMRIYGLPDQPLMTPVDGPADAVLYLHASAGQGLWLAFDTVRTTAARRNLLLGLLADFARWFRAAAMEQKVGVIPEEPVRRFWRETRAGALEKETADTGLRLGRIAEEGTTRRLDAGASTATDREGQNADLSPSPTLVAFAQRVLKLTCQDLAGTSSDTSEQDLRLPDDPDAPPNLSPMLHMESGDRLFTTVFFQTLEPDAMAATPAAIAERSPVDRAALVCDGFIREGDRRTDVLIVRAQERGMPECQRFMQRYRPRRRGQAFALLGNWSISGRDGSLFPPEGTAAAEPGANLKPTEEMQSFADEMRAELLRWLTLGDPSGSSLYRPGEPMFSPSLHLRKAEGTFMHRLAMMSFAQAQQIARKMTVENPDATRAAFVYDDSFRQGTTEMRELRFLVEARGDTQSWLFVQPYDVPTPGRPFSTRGPMGFVGRRDSLFPYSPPVPRPSPPPDPVATLRRRLALSGGGSDRADGGLLRFTAFRCVPSEAGLSVSYDEGKAGDVPWSSVREIVVRRLPADEPWKFATVVDFVVADSPSPIRILTGTTMLSFHALPPAVSTDNILRLCRYALERNPAIALEEATRAYCLEGGPCPRIIVMRQFADYDVRYG